MAPDARPIDDDQRDVEAIVAVLAEGPIHSEELWARLGLALDQPHPIELLLDPRVTLLLDGRLASTAALGRGRVALHRLDEEEAADRAVRMDDDVVGIIAVAALTAGHPAVQVGDERVELRALLDADGQEDRSTDPLVDLPAAWHPELAAGDLVALSLDDDGRPVLRAEGFAAAPEGDDAAVAVFGDALAQVGADLGIPLDDGGWILEIDAAVLQLWVDAPEAVDGLGRPLTEALAAASMPWGMGLVGSPGLAEHRIPLFLVGREILGGEGAPYDMWDLAEPLGLAWALIVGAADGDLDPRARDAAVAAVLSDPATTTALGSHLRTVDDDRLTDVADRLRGVADLDPGAPGPAQLLAEAALIEGATPEVVDRLGTALGGADPDEWEDAIELLGQLRATAGDLDGAVRAFARIGEDETTRFLGRWRATAAAGVGRNDPCPCGSGRKYKQCCLGRPARIALADRVELLWWKARTWCLRTQEQVLPWADELVEEGWAADALVLDLSLVEDDGLAVFSVELAGLLPADEAALVETWLERPRRLWEVGVPDADGGVPLVDLTGPDDGSALTVVRLPDAALTPGDVVLAVVVPAGEDHEQVVGQVVKVPTVARAGALALLADHPPGQEVLDWVLDLGPDALVRPLAGPT